MPCFDAELMAIDPTTFCLHFAPEVFADPSYSQLHKTAKLRRPTRKYESYCPDQGALKRRWKKFEKNYHEKHDVFFQNKTHATAKEHI